MFGLSLLLVLI